MLEKDPLQFDVPLQWPCWLLENLSWPWRQSFWKAHNSCCFQNIGLPYFNGEVFHLHFAQDFWEMLQCHSIRPCILLGSNLKRSNSKKEKTTTTTNPKCVAFRTSACVSMPAGCSMTSGPRTTGRWRLLHFFQWRCHCQFAQKDQS